MGETTNTYNMKQGLPNKDIQEDETVTDLFGNTVSSISDALENKPTLPNKWPNPDGMYSTLTELVAGAIYTDVFVIVDELLAVGNPKRFI